MVALFGVVSYINVSQAINRGVEKQLREQASGLANRLTVQFDGKFILELLPEQIALFRSTSENVPYYRIWNEDRDEVDSSHPDLITPFPTSAVVRHRGGNLEVVEDGPANSVVLVGRSMASEYGQLTQLASTGAVIGFVLLVVMLVGGWWLVSRALSPFDRINSAAMSISESNLSERIDVARMETELAQLSETINEAFDRLQGAFSRQTRFTADASHELRTPLSIIYTECDMALNRPRSSDEYVESLESVQRAAKRMKAVVEGLLTLARADSDQIALVSQQLELSEIIAETCEMLKPLMQEKRLTLEVDLEPVSIAGDRDRIGEAISNLLSNAVQFNREGGTIEVRLRFQSDQAVLTIRDTGIGIPESDLPFLFDRFYQVDQARQFTRGRGSGLGLAITKWIAEAHNGSLSVTSELDVGTEFELRLLKAKPS